MIEITLKRITVSQPQSEETFCYHANLFADGRFLGIVQNHGQGGADTILRAFGVTAADVSEVERRVALEHPKLDMSAYNMPDAPATLESVCAALVEVHVIKLELRKLLRKRVVLFKGPMPEEGGADLFEIKPPRGASVDTLLPQVRRRNPGAIILNDLPFEEAYTFYLRAN